MTKEHDDCVSRAEVLEMIEQIQDAGGFIGYSTYSEARYQVNNMSPVTPKLSTSEDCVSRQAVLDMAITIQTDDYSGNKILDVVEVEDIKDIRALPPVISTFPKDATNGDVMLAIFKEIQHYSDGKICADWWNAPYKRGGENE